MFTIGALSKASGVKIPTIRYYEQIGLLDEPERNSGNQRRYHDQAKQRLIFIRHARQLGFGLDAIRALITLHAHPDRSCSEATAIAGEQLDNVRQRIQQLRQLEQELVRIRQGCQNDDGISANCYILSALSADIVPSPHTEEDL